MIQFSEFQDIYERDSVEIKNVIFQMINESWLPNSTTSPGNQSKLKPTAFRKKNLLCFLSSTISVKGTANKKLIAKGLIKNMGFV